MHTLYAGDVCECSSNLFLSFMALLSQDSVIVIDDSDSERSGSELSPVKKRIK